MKSIVTTLTTLLMVLLMASCEKPEIIEKPGGGKPVPAPGSQKVLITLAALPGESNPVQDLSGLVTIVNEQGQPVITNQKVALRWDEKYKSDTITLAPGRYRLTHFLIVDKEARARFVAPVAGSQMGGQVQHPLFISFALPQPQLTQLSLDVLRLQAGDKPEKFGYPANAFNLPDVNIPDEEENNNTGVFKIKVRPLIKIGNIVYDSIPVDFTLTTWNAVGQPTVERRQLPAGTQDISLPKYGVKYDLQVNKWGTVDELTLQKADVQEGSVYTLGGSKEAKKLTSVVTSKFVNNSYLPLTKTVFEYNAGGGLQKIIHYRKRADNTTYIDATEQFTYNGAGQVEKIEKRIEHNTIVSETFFSYNQGGKISGMVQKEDGVQTDAQVTYTSTPGSTGISGDYNIDIRYQYSHNQFTARYTAQFKGGNKTEGDLNFSNGGREIIRYQYDFNINPFAHIGWPDLFFTHSSKHTLGAQQNGYDGNYAKSEFPAATNYTFDADGYPKEAITHYQHPFLGLYLYKTKTVYNY